MSDLEGTVGRLAAQRLVTKALQTRRAKAGSLLASLKYIKSIELKDVKDLGKGCHTRSTELYFYDAAYQPSSRATPVPEGGMCSG